MKDKAYVMNVVSHYRAQLDAVLADEGLQKSSSGTSTIDFTPDVTKTFNRGFTSYFVNGRSAAITSPDTPKMLGERIGVVASFTGRNVILAADADLHNGDGLCFFDADGVIRGATVNGANGRVITPSTLDGFAPGLTVYRNHDHEFLTRLAKSVPVRQIGVVFTLRSTLNGFTLCVEDEDGCTAEVSTICKREPAEKPEARPRDN